MQTLDRVPYLPAGLGYVLYPEGLAILAAGEPGQETLARRLYRSHSTLVEYERGHRLATLVAFATAARGYRWRSADPGPARLR